MKIVPKLNLNKVPQSVESGNLVLAKNIKVTQAKVIERDNPLLNILNESDVVNVVNANDETETRTIQSYNNQLLGHIVGINHKVYFFIKRIINPIEVNDIADDEEIQTKIFEELDKIKESNNSYDNYAVHFNSISDSNSNSNSLNAQESVVLDPDEIVYHEEAAASGDYYDKLYTVPASNHVYHNTKYKYTIIEYNEETNKFTEIQSAWNWGGGEIHGCVINNNTKDDILVIAEYNDDVDKQIPIKFINLTEGKHSVSDDESIYTQTPKIPITNLKVTRYINGNIPVGVYQFFIRYEINDYLHTAWFPCSNEIFTGDKKKDLTIQGSILHLNSLDISSKSFKLSVEHLYDENKNLYKTFQLGFILSHQDAIVAREWKHFDINTELITFNYSQDDIVEANIDDFVTPQFNIYSPKNLIYFKNRIYCSNYKTFDYDYKPQYVNPDIISGIGTKDIDVSTQNNKYIDNVPVSIGGDGYLHSSEMSDARFISRFTEFRFINELPQTRKKKYTAKNAYVHEQQVIDNVQSVLSFKEGIKDGRNVIYINPTDTDVDDVADIHRINESEDYIYTDGNPIILLKAKIKDEDTLIDLAIEGEAINKIDTSEYYTDDATSNETFIKNGHVNSQYKNTKCNSFNFIKKYIEGITENGTFYYDDNGNSKEIEYFKVCYLTDYKVSHKIKDTKVTGLPTWAVQIIAFLVTPLLGGGDMVSKQILKYIFMRELPFTTWDDIEVKVSYKYTETKIYPTLKNSVVNNYNPLTVENKTLVPNCTYDFYLHYVTDKGFVTNGNFIKTTKVTTDTTNDLVANNTRIYYPNINLNKLKIPVGFAAAFISIYKHPATTCELANVTSVGHNRYTGECFELDALLVKGIRNIIIKDSSGKIISQSGEYMSSNTTTPIKYFANCGVIEWEENPSDDPNDDGPSDDGIRYAMFDYYNNDEDYDLNKKDYKQLIKITPYLNNASIITESDLNLPGYLCQVKKLNEVDNRTVEDYIIDSYVDNDRPQAEEGTIIKVINSQTQEVTYKIYESNAWNDLNQSRRNTLLYFNRIYTDGNSIGDLTIKIDDDYSALALDTERYEELGIQVRGSREPNFIRSCFNLNYLSAIADSDILMKVITPESETQTTSGDTTTTEYHRNKEIVPLIPSLQISNYLTLTKTFKDYTRKTYSIRKDDNITEYDNTVIASNTNVDEEYQFVFTFLPTDYYNIPTNRGPIVKLMSVANTLYAHCTQSLFKFNSNPQLTTQEEQVGLEERDVFITGCSAVYDSIYGYGGLAKASHSIVTFDSYIFYDKYVNTIYAFDGNNIQSITEPIREVLRHFKPTDVIFGYDYANRRLFINLVKEESTTRNNICLSFSFIMKDIVSIHDMDYKQSFCTRIGCYFIDSNVSNLLVYKTSETFDTSVYLLSEDINITEKATTQRTNDAQRIINNINTFKDLDDLKSNIERKPTYYDLKLIEDTSENPSENPSSIAIGQYIGLGANRDYLIKNRYYILDIRIVDNTPLLNDFKLINDIQAFVLDTNNRLIDSLDSYETKITKDLNSHKSQYINTLRDSGIYTDINLYGNLTKQSFMPNSPIYYDNSSDNITHTKENNPSVIDVIFTEEFEKIKVLNAISWVCSDIKDFFSSSIPNAEYASEFSSADKILIYSDQTYTPLYDIIPTGSNDYSAQKLAIQPDNTPTYNCGVWTMNNFRDVKHILKINNPTDDDKSLIYGKYLATRFVFENKNFRLENVIFNTQDYEKI